MGVFEKLKNALFEEEYVEVEEKPKKEKKVKPREEKVEEKPIAKKIVLPGKKESRIEKIEELEEEALDITPRDEDFEIQQSNKNDFMVMDDDDFKVEEEVVQPKIVKVIEEEILEEKKDNLDNSSYYYDNNKRERVENYSYYSAANPYEKEKKPYEKERSPYGLDGSNKVQVHEYGGYEKNEEKAIFRPSPIISPIYGILDKNYKKEDVVSKREVHLTSAYTRSRVSVDDVRNKAYGSLSDDIAKEINKPPRVHSFDVAEELEDDDDNLLVDLSADEGKPSVKEVTVGDALEYFEDLGLEYNVDYVDASKERATARRVRSNYDNLELDPEKEELVEKVNKIAKLGQDKDDEVNTIRRTVDREIKLVPKKTSIDETIKKNDVKEEKIDIDSDDNLFDLIDSMYQED